MNKTKKKKKNLSRLAVGKHLTNKSISPKMKAQQQTLVKFMALSSCHTVVHKIDFSLQS